jgi:ribosome-associated toxin RatA of RatAB toxin-antitoxin module
MHSVLITALIPGYSRDEAFDHIADFERYSELLDSVRVEMMPPGPGGAVETRWEVQTRTGPVRWSECDMFDKDSGVITFKQLNCTFVVFNGSWFLEDTGDGTAVTFRASFDFGGSNTADSQVGRLLLRSRETILRGLFPGAAVSVTTAEHGKGVYDMAFGELVPVI